LKKRSLTDEGVLVLSIKSANYKKKIYLLMPKMPRSEEILALS